MLSIPFCAVLTGIIWAFLVCVFRKSLPRALPAFDPTAGSTVLGDDHAAGAIHAGIVKPGIVKPGIVKPGSDGLRTEPRATRFDEAVIVATAALTILTWVFFGHVQSVFGNIGLVGILPIAVYGGAGYLTKEDFNSMPWDVLVLIGGGLSLGTAVESSGLLITLGDGLALAVSGARSACYPRWLTCCISRPTPACSHLISLISHVLSCALTLFSFSQVLPPPLFFWPSRALWRSSPTSFLRPSLRSLCCPSLPKWVCRSAIRSPTACCAPL
jgi:hypothetical protein